MLSPEPQQTHKGFQDRKGLQPLIVILGPTAVGKTEIAIQLAERMDGEIVSADSRLFYRGMNIGTAKPSRTERDRIHHHLIDVADPDEIWSLEVFQKAARRAIAGIHSRGKLPFLVGGTGQYIRAVIDAWVIPRVEPNPHLRSVLEFWARDVGYDGLHARLAVLDSQAAANIDPRNLRRTIRALEVILTNGRRFSTQSQSGPAPYHLLRIGLTRPRPELYARVDTRIDSMLASGFIDEVKSLLAKGHSPNLPAFSAIGYREIIDFLRGRVTLDEAVTLVKRKTRVFIRRQANWFKPTDPTIHWFQVSAETVGEMEAIIIKWCPDLGIC